MNSLIQQGQRKLILNLAEVPYIDSAGLGEIVRTYTTVSRQGGSLKLLNLTKRIQDLLPDHQAADGVRDVRVRRGRDQELRLGQRLVLASRASWRAAHFRTPWRGTGPVGARSRRVPCWSTCSSRSGRGSGRRTSWSSRGCSSGGSSSIPRAAALAGGRVRDLLRALRRRLPGQRRRRPRGGPAAPAEVAAPDRLGRPAAAGGARGRGRARAPRRWRSAFVVGPASRWSRSPTSPC